MQGHCSDHRQSYKKCVDTVSLRQSYEHLACLQQPSILKITQKWQENEHVEKLVFDVSATIQPCDFVRQSCSDNILRLLHEIQKYVIIDRCLAATSL